MNTKKIREQSKDKAMRGRTAKEMRGKEGKERRGQKGREG